MAVSYIDQQAAELSRVRFDRDARKTGQYGGSDPAAGCAICLEDHQKRVVRSKLLQSGIFRCAELINPSSAYAGSNLCEFNCVRECVQLPDDGNVLIVQIFSIINELRALFIQVVLQGIRQC